MSAEEPKKKTLGRGLAALLGDDETESAPIADPGRGGKVVPIEFVSPNPDQPRRRFDEAAIDGLVDSIREKGVIQPILVRPHPEDPNLYQIVAGERRWRAAQRAKLHEVPVTIKELSDRDTLEIALIENIHREDLTPLEEAEGYQNLITAYGHTQEALANAVGKSRSHIANMLRLLTLPDEVQSMVDDGLISAGHARALIGSSDPSELAHMVLKKDLSVRETEKFAKDAKKTSVKTAVEKIGKAVDQRDADIVALERSLADTLGLLVQLKSQGEAGSVTIHYKTLDQLDDLLTKLNAA